MLKLIIYKLVIINLIGIITTSLVACNNKPKIQEYKKEQLTQLKEKNNINTKDGILEWVAPQETPFNQVNNKWYFVVWRGEKTDDWRIIKFKHSDLQEKILDSYNRFKLKVKIGLHPYPDLVIDVNIFNHEWWEFNINIYFKAVYCWNGNSEPNIDVENKLKSYLDL